ncbi:hypothetical protein V498_08849, partial [Pseudogymnoascus sp. VKM F-4517 (FW-2822)]
SRDPRAKTSCLRAKEISSGFNGHSLENLLEQDLTSYVYPEDFEDTPNNYTSELISDNFEFFLESLPTDGSLPFGYDYCNYSEGNTILGLPSASPSLAPPPSSHLHYADISTSTAAPVAAPHRNTWYPQSDHLFPAPEQSPPSLSHSPPDQGPSTHDPSLSPQDGGRSLLVHNSRRPLRDDYEDSLLLLSIDNSISAQRQRSFASEDKSTLTSPEESSLSSPSGPALQQSIHTRHPVSTKQPADPTPESSIQGNPIEATRRRPAPRIRRKILQFTCGSCEKLFARRCDLNKHAKNHERAFKCTTAGCSHTRGFALQKDLQRHIDTIHRKSTFTCDYPDFLAVYLLNSTIRHPSTYEATVICPFGSPAQRESSARYLKMLPAPFVSTNFHAKEELRYITTFRHDKELPENEIIGINANPSLGDLETIWNSMATYRPMNQQVKQELLCISSAVRPDLDIGRFSKGWNVEWGSVQVQSFHARIVTLFGRLCSSCCSKHGFIRNLTLWAVHSVLVYKVYPSFWGRLWFYKVIYDSRDASIESPTVPLKPDLN